MKVENTKKLEPLNGRVLVARQKEEALKTAAGVFLPESVAKGKSGLGKVIAVSQGTFLKNGERRPPVLKEGDIVVLPKYAGTSVSLEGYEEDECLILGEDEILAKVIA